MVYGNNRAAKSMKLSLIMYPLQMKNNKVICNGLCNFGAPAKANESLLHIFWQDRLGMAP